MDITLFYVDFWRNRGVEKGYEWDEDKQFRVHEILADLDFHDVLEIGCGDGEFSRILLTHTGRVEGIDLSPDRVLASPINHVVCGDFLDHKYTKQFDLVCCSHVMLHIPPILIEEFYNKMKQLAKKYILIIEPDISKYDSLSWKENNYPHDYRKLMGNPETTTIEERVTAYLIT